MGDVVTETSVVEPNAVEGQPQEASELPAGDTQHVVPSFVTYSAAPVTYIAAPTMVAPPPTVSHYTWNGEQYPSMEAALSAMMAQAEANQLAAAAPAEAEETKEEPKEEVKTRG